MCLYRHLLFQMFCCIFKSYLIVALSGMIFDFLQFVLYILFFNLDPKINLDGISVKLLCFVIRIQVN